MGGVLWGIPRPRLDREPPCRPGMGGTQGTPSVKDWMGYPPPIQTWDRGCLGNPPTRPGMEGYPGYPLSSKTGWGTPLLSAKRALATWRRCASCVHAGGLSCIQCNWKVRTSVVYNVYIKLIKERKVNSIVYLSGKVPLDDEALFALHRAFLLPMVTNV